MQNELATNVQRSVSDFGEWFTANQSRLLTAVVLVALGILLAIILRAVVVRIVRTIERVIPGFSYRTSFAGLAKERRISDIVGAVVFWAVLLFFLAPAADALGVPLLSGAVASLSELVPRVLVAVLILVIGLVFGNVARGAITAAAAATGTFAPALGHVVRLGIILAAGLIAVAELGVDITLLTAILSVGLAALLGGFAIAFGLGARTAISNIVGSHYLRQTFEIGQRVRVGGVEGTIAALTSTAVILTVPEGRTIIPAKQFTEMASTLVLKGDGA